MAIFPPAKATLLNGAAHMTQGPRDPVRAAQTLTTEEMFRKIGQVMHGASLENVLDVASNLLVNTIRQGYASRREAEAAFDERMGRLKSILLEQHYDSVTGKRKSGVFAFDQKVEIGRPFK